MGATIINWLIFCHRQTCLIVVLAFAVGSVHATEVTLPYRGLTLNADLQLAADRQLADGVILITHGGLAHNGMEIIVNLQKELKDRGYSTLAINLSLGLNNRHGMYDCKITQRHRNEDAVNEIGVWVDWLQRQGAKRVVLLGHSRGGAQTALYGAEHDKGLIKAVVLMAPAIKENTGPASYQQHYKLALEPLLKKAEKLVKEGKGNSKIEHIGLLNCGNTSATAASFVSYYGNSQRVDTPSLLPKIKKPVLVLVAGGDEVVVGLEPKLAQLANDKYLQVKVIDGADHTFRDLYLDDAVDGIDAFLKGIGYPSPAQ